MANRFGAFAGKAEEAASPAVSEKSAEEKSPGDEASAEGNSKPAAVPEKATEKPPETKAAQPSEVIGFDGHNGWRLFRQRSLIFIRR